MTQPANPFRYFNSSPEGFSNSHHMSQARFARGGLTQDQVVAMDAYVGKLRPATAVAAPKWTSADIATLTTLANAGRSCAEIATATPPFTRHAVGSKAHRLGLKLHGGDNGKHLTPRARQHMTPAPERRRRTKVYALIKELPVEESQTARPWMERAAGQCAWPVS